MCSVRPTAGDMLLPRDCDSTTSSSVDDVIAHDAELEVPSSTRLGKSRNAPS